MYAPASVLVVDDDQATLDLLVDVLGPAGYTVYTARTAANAITTIAQNRPDLILLDIVMPYTTGLEVLRHVRATGQHTLPIILMTARPCTSDYVCLQQATDYIQKPFDLDRLLECIAVYTNTNSTPANYMTSTPVQFPTNAR
jgi:DNA-binding response OmpR family regulator